MRIALVGCGAIGRSILELLHDDARIRVDAIVVSESGIEVAQTIADRFAVDAVVDSTIPLKRVDLVVEAAGHTAIEQHVLPALEYGTPCVVASTGALSKPGFPERLEEAAKRGGTQIHLVAGAIGAIDALVAARIG